jgi:ferredoxin
MPTVTSRGRTIDCETGAVLRDVLLDAGETPHNGRARVLNCRGHGSCGTCAVAVSGPVSAPTWREPLRLAIPPHDPEAGLRLACQTRVLGDVTVEKFGGFWGQHVEDEPGTSRREGSRGPDDE